jgi:hypothetical protein
MRSAGAPSNGLPSSLIYEVWLPLWQERAQLASAIELLKRLVDSRTALRPNATPQRLSKP